MLLRLLTGILIGFILSLITVYSLYKLGYLPPQNNLIYEIRYSDLNKNTQKQIDCLTDNIYYEARGESEVGQQAVALTTMNRVRDPHWPKTICGVVKQKTHKTCQFSWYCDKEVHKKKINKVMYHRAREIAMTVYMNYEHIEDVTSGAVFYHAYYVQPDWQNAVFIKQIGAHLFYGLKQT